MKPIRTTFATGGFSEILRHGPGLHRSILSRSRLQQSEGRLTRTDVVESEYRAESLLVDNEDAFPRAFALGVADVRLAAGGNACLTFETAGVTEAGSELRLSAEEVGRLTDVGQTVAAELEHENIGCDLHAEAVPCALLGINPYLHSAPPRVLNGVRAVGPSHGPTP